jgi:D-amino-acid dehydrogenase
VKTLVLGAGVIGVTTAYFLARAGHQVTVIDQDEGPAMGTSFANGGQLSFSHPEPWASPDVPAIVWRALGGGQSPFHVPLRWDPALWSWGVRFLRNCTAQRRHRHAARIAGLALHSRQALAEIRAGGHIRFDHRRPGTLHLFTDPRELHKALDLAQARRGFGIDQEPLDPEGCVRIEPALAERRDRLSGGIFAPGDETGDAFLFTQALAQRCARDGVAFRFGVTVQGLEAHTGRVTAVATTQGRLQADHYVLALGVESPRVARGLSLRLPIYPVKGYSISLPLTARHTAPRVNIIHEARRVVAARLGPQLRIAGGADFTGYDRGLHRSRAQAILDAMRELFPAPGDLSHAGYWTGLRPMTPDGMPILGPTRYDNLYLNTGHGSLGWTLACGSAQVLAELICGREPPIDIRGFSLDRFG